jgi:hypothetical protein
MIEWMLVLAGAVNRLVEFFKVSFIDTLAMSEQVRQAITLGLSMVLGVVSALITNANVLAIVPDNPYTAQIPAFAGLIAGGILIGLGANAVNVIGDFLGSLRPPTIVNPPAAPPAVG